MSIKRIDDLGQTPLHYAAKESHLAVTTVGLRGFGHGLFLIQYIFDMDERRLRFDRVLRERGGGPLGIVRVREVVIAPDRFDDAKAQGTKLLGPSSSGETHLWTVGDGPKIRLVKAGDPRVGDFVIEVRNLSRAAGALRRLKISAHSTARQIRIDHNGMSGLRRPATTAPITFSGVVIRRLRSIKRTVGFKESTRLPPGYQLFAESRHDKRLT